MYPSAHGEIVRRSEHLPRGIGIAGDLHTMRAIEGEHDIVDTLGQRARTHAAIKLIVRKDQEASYVRVVETG